MTFVTTVETAAPVATDDRVKVATEFLRRTIHFAERTRTPLKQAAKRWADKAPPAKDTLLAVRVDAIRAMDQSHSQLRWSAVFTLASHNPLGAVVDALAELYDEDPAATLVTALDVFSHHDIFAPLLSGPLLGRLPRTLFEETCSSISHSQYLRRHLNTARPVLTGAQQYLAGALASEWAGTLEGLFDIARLMAPA
jgi:hypothetical protein